MAQARTKPVKAVKGKTAPAAKGRVKKAVAPAAKAKPVKPVELLAEGTFVKFNGYRSEVEEADRIFKEGATLYICGVQQPEGDNPALYDCIAATDVTKYLENPEDEEIEGQQCAPQEVVALKGGALDTARDQYLPIPSIGKMETLLASHSGDLIETARDLHQQHEESYFYLGGVLARIRQEGSYLTENGGEYEASDSAWNDFCMAEFDFSGAKGGDLARLYSTFAAIPEFDPASLSRIGWSKARSIQRYVTDENVEELIGEAEERPRTELDTFLKEKFTSAEGTTPSGAKASRGAGVKSITLTFKLFEESANAVQMVLGEAKKKYGVETDGEALEQIVMAWAGDNIESDRKAKSITSKIAKAQGAKDSAKPKPTAKAPVREDAAAVA